MILIGEGGSTKADWWFLRNGETQSIKTIGFNPLFHTSDSVIDGLNQSEELKSIAADVTDVYFFGASCSSEERNAVIENGLNIFFSKANIFVDHDLKGAAIATCGDDTGVVCILGTGSNAAYYDGDGFGKRVPALGYVLGDEGSGAQIGKKLLADFLYNLVPGELSNHLSKTVGLTKDSIFTNVYQKPHANIYLASFAKVLADFKHLEYTRQLVTQCFKEFIEYHIMCYPYAGYSLIHFVGSVAHHYREFLIAAFIDFNLKPSKIIAEPGKEILNYFLNKKSG